MKKKLTRALLACLLALTVILVCGCSSEPAPTEPEASSWKVTFYESDGTTVLAEAEAADRDPPGGVGLYRPDRDRLG